MHAPVAHETMTRARANVELLVDRLANMGFDFLLPRTAGSAWMGPTGPEISTDDLLVHCLPRPDADALMAVIQETTAGVFPLSVRAWYQIVGDVSLLGDHPLLSSYKLPMLDGRVMYSDPLMIVPLRSLVNELEFLPEVSTKFSFFPDKYFKAGRGGAMPMEIVCEGAQADAILHNEPHGLSFVQYLRRSFAWGGFPG